MVRVKTDVEKQAEQRMNEEDMQEYLEELNSLTPEQRKDYEQYKKEVLEEYVRCYPSKKEKKLLYVEKDASSLCAIMQHFKSYLEDGQRWIHGPIQCLDLLFEDDDQIF